MKPESKILRGFTVAFFIIVTCVVGYGIYEMMGGLIKHNPVMAIIVIPFIIALVYLFVRTVKRVYFPVVLLFALSSCHYAKSNQQVLTSSDCGKTWVKAEAGESVPRGGVNPCYQKVVIPNYPMSGDTQFIANLNGKDKIKATIHIDYDYNIVDGLLFMKEAKSLGKSNVDADDEEAIGLQFESAENRVIDKRIKEITKGLLESADIVELDISDMEHEIQTKSQEILDKYGIRLNFITFVLIPDELTRQAIDASIAMKIYESKGYVELGKQIMIQKAGATSINVTTASGPVTDHEPTATDSK